mgnify:FL=1
MFIISANVALRRELPSYIISICIKYLHILVRLLVAQLSIRCQGVSNLDWQQVIMQVCSLKLYHSIPTAFTMIDVFIIVPYPSC